jgi:hypothetical protein
VDKTTIGNKKPAGTEPNRFVFWVYGKADFEQTSALVVDG